MPHLTPLAVKVMSLSDRLAEYGVLGLVLAIVFSGGGTMMWFLLKRLVEGRPGEVQAQTKALADLALAIKEVATEDRESHANALAAYTAANDKSNTSFEARQGKLIDAFTTNTHDDREMHQRQHDENRGLLQQILQETKDHRHELLNLTHQAGLRRATDEAAKRKPGEERRKGDES